MDLFNEVIRSSFESQDQKELTFRVLPGYAGFLLQNCVKEMAVRQYSLSSELAIPLLRHFNHLSEEAIINLCEKNISDLLLALQKNEAPEYIQRTVSTWINDQIPEFPRTELLTDDIALLSYFRRRLFREFINRYSAEVETVIAILDEMDRFLSWMDKTMYKALFSIQQELQEQIQELAHLGNWLWDLTTHKIIWSKELFAIYELDPVEYVTFDIAVYNHPDDTDMVMDNMRISFDTKKPHDFYYRIRVPSGKEKWLHAKGEVLTNEQGVVERMYGTLQDVTEQRENEKRHREYENFIQKITDVTPSLITVYNVKTGEYLFVSHALETLLGYDPVSALKQGAAFFGGIVHPDDLPRIMEENSRALGELNRTPDLPADEQIREFRYRVRHKDGEYRWLQTYGTIFERDRYNAIEKVINISNDITEQIANKTLLDRKTAEIWRQEDRYYKMVDEVQEYAIILLTKDGIIENWNKGAEKIKGYNAGEIVGQHFRIFYTNADRENGMPEKLIALAADKGKSSYEGWRVRKDGSRFWASVVLTALHDGDGALLGFSKVTRDLTSVKIAEEKLKSYTAQLEEKNRELQKKNKELESFTYVASHDLQEPLRKIKLWCNRLMEMEAIGEPVLSGLNRIYGSTARMQSLIEGLLNYTQLDDARAKKESVDLNEILRDVLEDFAESLEEKQAEVKVDPLPVSFLAVRLQMQQLFANILSNSVKYARVGAPLQIVVGCIIVAGEGPHAGRYYEISFADNGIGFNQDYSNKIFEIFQRLDNTKVSGTGIGLAICKKIVDNHGGTIRAVSETGAGTTFYIRLPVAP